MTKVTDAVEKKICNEISNRVFEKRNRADADIFSRCHDYLRNETRRKLEPVSQAIREEVYK